MSRFTNISCHTIFIFFSVSVRPFLIRGPQNQTAVVGSSVVFQCRIGGDPLPDVLWRRTASGGNMPLRKFSWLHSASINRKWPGSHVGSLTGAVIHTCTGRNFK